MIFGTRDIIKTPLKLTCVGDDRCCCGCCDWSPLPPILVGIADDGTAADTVAVVTVLPLPPLAMCECDDWSLCVTVCCEVAVGDDEEFEVVATEFCCCPPAAME